MRPATEAAARIAGFVAAEATFVASTGPTATTFAFAVELGAKDEGACAWLAVFFGCGTVHRYERRRPSYDDEVRFQIRKLRDLVEIVVPFMDEHLPPSYKRDQYLVWRAALLPYWQHQARRPSICTCDGCDAPNVAHGRCHRHDMQWRREKKQRQQDHGA